MKQLLLFLVLALSVTTQQPVTEKHFSPWLDSADPAICRVSESLKAPDHDGETDSPLLPEVPGANSAMPPASALNSARQPFSTSPTLSEHPIRAPPSIC